MPSSVVTSSALIALVMGVCIVHQRRAAVAGEREAAASAHEYFATVGGETRLKACLSGTYVNHKIGIFTMLAGEDPKKMEGYVDSAVRLLHSARRHSTVAFDALVLELEELPLDMEQKEMLREAGWGICTVARLAPPDEEKTYKYFKDQFSKFRLWAMDEFRTIVYFDADTYVVGDIDGLLTTQLDGKQLAAAHDFWDKCTGYWCEGFNMGVFAIHPSRRAYEDLLHAHAHDNALKYNKRFAEQGFLNAFYKNQWHDIGFKYAANQAVYAADPSYWEAHEGDIRVIHYTVKKPWKGRECANSPYAPTCEWWVEARG